MTAPGSEPAPPGAVFEIPRPSAGICGGGRFPVRRVYCIGRNYVDHALEMGADPTREAPFFFQKPSDAVVGISAGDVGDYAYPPLTSNLHFEVELVVFLSGGGRDIAPDDALGHVFGYAVGIDMTRRDRQQDAKERRHPWEIGKSFDASAPVGEIIPAAEFGRPDRGGISLSVGGEVRQRADLAEMIWSVPEQIAALSRSSLLCPGDAIMTGTPKGVGALSPGDEVTARIDRLPDLRLRIR